MTSNKPEINDSSTIKWSHLTWVLALIVMATLIRFPLQPVIQHTSPFLFYIPVVVLVAIIFGKRYGLYATVLSALPANYFWMTPENTFALDLNELFQILGFSLAGFSISWVSDEAHKHQQLEGHLRATLASMSDAVVTTDCHGRIVYLNPAAQLLLEYTDRELTGRLMGEVLELMDARCQRFLQGKFQASIDKDEIESLPRRVTLISRTGAQCPVEQSTSRLLDGNGRRIGSVILFRRLEPVAQASPTLQPQ